MFQIFAKGEKSILVIKWLKLFIIIILLEYFCLLQVNV